MIEYYNFYCIGLEEAISKLCSNKDIDLSIKNNQGWTVLHEVVHPKAFNSCPIIRKNRSKYFEILLGTIESNKNISINVNALDSEGNTLLQYAILSGECLFRYCSWSSNMIYLKWSNRVQRGCGSIASWRGSTERRHLQNDQSFNMGDLYGFVHYSL